MNKEELIVLKLDIADKFRELVKTKEYKWAKWSGNLANTITAQAVKRNVVITIPAPIYDVKKFRESNVVIPTNRGSYADENDAFSGGLEKYKGEKSGYYVLGGKRYTQSKNHINFVERNIIKAIEIVCSEKNYKYEIIGGKS